VCKYGKSEREGARERERERYPEKVHQDPHVLQ